MVTERSFDFDYQIDGLPIPLPDARVELRRKGLQAPDGGRDEAGYYHGSLLRSIRVWEFSYKVLAGEDFARLLVLLTGKSSFLFRFRGEQGLPDQAVCRASDLQAQLYDRRRDIYTGVTFSVEEC